MRRNRYTTVFRWTWRPAAVRTTLPPVRRYSSSVARCSAAASPFDASGPSVAHEPARAHEVGGEQAEETGRLPGDDPGPRRIGLGDAGGVQCLQVTAPEALGPVARRSQRKTHVDDSGDKTSDGIHLRRAWRPRPAQPHPETAIAGGQREQTRADQRVGDLPSGARQLGACGTAWAPQHRAQVMLLEPHAHLARDDLGVDVRALEDRFDGRAPCGCLPLCQAIARRHVCGNDPRDRVVHHRTDDHR